MFFAIVSFFSPWTVRVDILRMGLVERLPQRGDGGGQRRTTSREDEGLEAPLEIISDERGHQKVRESCVGAHCQFRAMLHQRRAFLHRRGRRRGCT
jgi:hypothetical protein